MHNEGTRRSAIGAGIIGVAECSGCKTYTKKIYEGEGQHKSSESHSECLPFRCVFRVIDIVISRDGAHATGAERQSDRNDSLAPFTVPGEPCEG